MGLQRITTLMDSSCSNLFALGENYCRVTLKAFLLVSRGKLPDVMAN